MTIQIDPNAFRIRVEAKVNVIAKAVNWLVALAFAAAAYTSLRTLLSVNLEPNSLLIASLAIGAIASWLIVDRPMKRLEKQYPLFDDED